MSHKFHISPHDNQARSCGAESCPFGKNVISGNTMEEAQRNYAIANGLNNVPKLSKKNSPVANMEWKSVDTTEAFASGKALADRLKADGYKVRDANGIDFPVINIAKPQVRKASPIKQVAQRTLAASSSAIDQLRVGKDFNLSGRDGSSHSIKKTSSGYTSVSTLSDGTVQEFPKVASFSFASN